ncbi:MAG: Wzz/FepE/Etk N-terminal domain-containing protein [Desulfobulbaceae bacterium]|nr:Wzz/FepE/Etk N-terminal domain-containing protein [Desulfobulbaceae bacterium]
MENQQRQQVKKYLDLLLQRWKLIVACLLVAVTVGLALYLRIPKLYRSSALLSYEQQQINPGRMAPEREGQRLRDTVSTLSELVMSRNNLEKLILQFDLYPEARQKLPIEDVIEAMRKDITISPSSRGDTFTVDFQGTQQDKVMKVTNALGSKFIEENLKYREERATETSKYTEDELNLAKVVLDKKEQAMRDYKLQYYNEMPEQRESNIARLSSLHEQYQGMQNSVQDLERTRVMAQEQIALRKRLGSALAGGAQGAAGQDSSSAQPMGKYERLQQLRQYLDGLLNKYTEKHPEVRRTRQLIAKIEVDLESEPPSEKSTAGSENDRVYRSPQDPEIQQLQLQVKEIDLNIKNLKKDQEKIKGEINRYEKWIEAAPVREAEWNALTRDYSELRRHYDYLVAQNLQAGSVEHLERKQKGSKFKIIDPARFPDKPFKPDFKKMLLLALGIGGGLGVGLTLGLDFLDTSFKDVHDIESVLGVEVVSSIPYIETSSEIRKQRIYLIFSVSFFFLYTVALGAALIYFYLQGRIVL